MTGPKNAVPDFRRAQRDEPDYSLTIGEDAAYVGQCGAQAAILGRASIRHLSGPIMAGEAMLGDQPLMHHRRVGAQPGVHQRSDDS
jgi:hypothetical protein